jgi:membrane-bound metal-dependent hydrolase YbcI (DUF457 family)
MAVRARWARVPLAALAVASVVPDFVDLALAALHVCAPNGAYSHSLPAAAVLAALCGLVAALWLRIPGAGIVAAGIVLLHLPADYVTGFKVLWPGGPLIGFNLYSHPVADFALEAVVVFAGWRYLRNRSPAPAWATRRLVLVALFALQAAMDIATYSVGPVKPNACGAGGGSTVAVAPMP